MILLEIAKHMPWTHSFTQTFHCYRPVATTWHRIPFLAGDTPRQQQSPWWFRKNKDGEKLTLTSLRTKTPPIIASSIWRRQNKTATYHPHSSFLSSSGMNLSLQTKLPQCSGTHLPHSWHRHGTRIYSKLKQTIRTHSYHKGNMFDLLTWQKQK